MNGLLLVKYNTDYFNQSKDWLSDGELRYLIHAGELPAAEDRLKAAEEKYRALQEENTKLHEELNELKRRLEAAGIK